MKKFNVPIEVNVPNGTPPITVTSETVVDNFNADMVDGMNADDLKFFSMAMAIALG